MLTALLALAICAAGLAAPIDIGDERFSLTLNDEGRISSLTVAGDELIPPGATGGISVYDVGDRAGSMLVGDSVDLGPEGAEVTCDCPDLQLRVGYRLRPGPRSTVQLDITVTDLKKADRGMLLEFALPVAGEGWHWWDDADTSRAIEGDKQYANLTRLRGLPGLPEFDNAANLAEFGQYSWYPVAAITGPSGLGLAKPPRAAGLFRLGFDAARSVLYSAHDFALSPDTAVPGEARFSLVLFPLAADAGFRGALAELYDLWPEDFQCRVPSYGGWMPFARLEGIPDVDEFGFAYQEGAPSPAFDDALGASSFVYFHCAGEFASIPGYTRDQPLPDYETQLAAVNAVAKSHTGIDNVWDVTGVQLPDGKIEILPERVYGHLFAQPCVDPDLPYGRAMVENLVKRVTAKPTPEGIDGCYYDGIAVGLDYSREHFKVAAHPLLWDPARKRPVAYNFFASLEWAEEIATRLHPADKMTMLNDSSMTSFSFAFPYIDVLGAEGAWANSDAEFNRARAYCYQKPFCTLLKTNYNDHPQAKIESYMRDCLAHGVLFGFFDISPSGANPGSSYWQHPEWYDRDRPLFRRYVPLCAELCRAGWEPVQWASTASPGAVLERFGGGRNAGGDLVYFTVRRDPDAAGGGAVEVALSRQVACAYAEDAVAVDLLTGASLPLSEGRLVMDVPAGEVGALAVGKTDAVIRRCLDRTVRMIEGRERLAAAHKGAAGDLGAWQPYMTGCALDETVAHSGKRSVRVTLADATQMAGANQALNLNQKDPEELIVSGFSRAEGVSGEKGRGYCIYVDSYYHNGDKLYGQIADFDTGTHDWQRAEVRISPKATIASMQVYCMFRGTTGTVWFDDLHVATAADPERNLLENPGFEPAQPAGWSELGAAAATRLAALKQETQALQTAGATEAAALEELAQKAETDLAWLLGQGPGQGDQRSVRDLSDARDHLQLAARIARGQAVAPLWADRLTPAFPLVQPRPKAAPPAATTGAARVPQGSKVTVDGSYEGYGPGPLTDGKINPKTDDWTQVAWASDDTESGHWIRIEFPAPVTVRKVTLHWAYDNGALYNSQRIALAQKVGEEWTEVTAEATDAQPARTVIRIAPTKTGALMIRQPAGGGPVSRPGIMWVSEIEVE